MDRREKRRRMWAAVRDPNWVNSDRGKIRLSAVAGIAGLLLIVGLVFGQVVNGAPSTNAAVTTMMNER